VFPALKSMTLTNTSIVPASKIFTHLRLLALESIHYVDMFHSKDMIRSLAMALQTACGHKLLTNITLDGSISPGPQGAEPVTLGLDDVLPFAAFNLTHMRIELDWSVDLKDTDLLRLASDCPRIESLSINHHFGWRSAGITPACLVQVLRRCPLLGTFCIVLDTRESQTLTSGGPVDPLPSGTRWVAELADSVIEADSVPALAAFFGDCVPSDGEFCFSSWDSGRVRTLHPGWQAYEERWKEVDKMVKEIVLERSKRSSLCSQTDQLTVE